MRCLSTRHPGSCLPAGSPSRGERKKSAWNFPLLHLSKGCYTRSEESARMPIYEYRCASCGKVFEVLERIAAKPARTACPSCGVRRSARLFSRF
ncbi:MAG: zinc ribbon domain-containing protein, partial [Chlamydiota bacterium]